MKVLAPGKLILSGEHAVVYGQPALAMAINRYSTASIHGDLLPHVSFNFSDLAYQRRVSFSTLDRIKARIKRKYHQFIDGEFSIREVLHKPFELAQFAFSSFFEALNIKLTHGMRIHVQSDIPIGCGLGSSAATIVSVLGAIAHHLNMELTQETLFNMALSAENMQHGRSSGLDLRVSLQGGCIYMQDQKIQTRSLPKVPLYLVNTGTPQTTTGECVQHAARFFNNSSLGNEFGAVTLAMDHAFTDDARDAVRLAVKQNHTLLMNIGVVPARVQQFIHDVMQAGGAAKTCGAGAVAGDNAGIVMVLLEDLSFLSSLCERYGYTLLPILPEARGVCVA